MARYLLRRLAQFPLILAVTYLLTFALVWVAPGSPFEGERGRDAEQVRQLKEQFHAETAVGFLTYYPYRVLVHGDFGPSLHQRGHRVGELIGARIGVSLTLGFAALVIAVTVGMLVGTLGALYRDGPLDWAALALTLLGISVPSFVTAAVLSLVFIGKLQWFDGQWDSPDDVVLPALALSLVPMAYVARLQRAAMLDTLGADYVRTARAKGLAKRAVVVKHCLRNAFLPVFSYLGPAAAFALTGSFVVERVFGLQGLGEMFVQSVTSRDQTLILALVMIYATIVQAFNLIVDVGYAFVDPRIDVAGGGGAKA